MGKYFEPAFDFHSEHGVRKCLEDGPLHPDYIILFYHRKPRNWPRQTEEQG